MSKNVTADASTKPKFQGFQFGFGHGPEQGFRFGSVVVVDAAIKTRKVGGDGQLS